MARTKERRPKKKGAAKPRRKPKPRTEATRLATLHKKLKRLRTKNGAMLRDALRQEAREKRYYDENPLV